MKQSVSEVDSVFDLMRMCIAELHCHHLHNATVPEIHLYLEDGVLKATGIMRMQVLFDNTLDVSFVPFFCVICAVFLRVMLLLIL